MWNNISNFAAIIAERMVRTKLNDLDLLPLGARDESYDGNYRDAAILPKDLVAAADAQNTGSYELDLGATNVVTVTTQKGIIDILGMGSVTTTPDPSYANPEVIYINNPALDLTVANRENIYIQYSVYYSPSGDDTAIPYVLTTGVTTGLELSIFNASPVAAGSDQWTGEFYLYYELYTI
jgi:hypothetical protein